MTPEEAIEIVAKRAVANVLFTAEDMMLWEDYPEIGEDDWESVVEAASKMRPVVPDEQFDEAYRLLASRAPDDDEGDE